MGIREELAEAIDGLISGNGFGSDYTPEELGEWADTYFMPLIRFSQAQAWERAWRDVRVIPHWYNPEEAYGEFDLQPLGPDTTSEHGAFMAVREVFSNNPYQEAPHD